MRISRFTRSIRDVKSVSDNPISSTDVRSILDSSPNVANVDDSRIEDVGTDPSIKDPVPLHGAKWLGDAFRYYRFRSLSVLRVFLTPPKSRLYVMGDSHSRIFRNHFSVMQISVGPLTLHRAGSPGESERLFAGAFSWPRRLRYLPFPKPTRTSTVVLSFGEIDFRVHVDRQVIRQNVCPEIIISGLIESALSLVERVSQLSGSKIIFLAIVPPTDQYFDENYPTSGSLIERIQWVRAFNTQLVDCFARYPELRARVLDVSGRFTQLDGSLNPKFSDGTVHYGELVREEMFSATRELSGSIL